MSVASEYERLMLDLINEERTSRGLDPVTLELRLNDASEDHSIWMDETGNFDHTGINGSDPGDRIRDAGFELSGNWTWGENIALQSERGAAGIADDVADLHTSLMNSPGHRANILNPDFDLIGIGIVEGDGRGYDAVYVTQKFASTSAEVQLDLPTPPSDPFMGTAGQDILAGDGTDNLMTGLDGSDTLNGGAGSDTLQGGRGSDRLEGGADADTLLGGNGWDQMYGGKGQDQMFGGNGRDQMFGGNADDLLRGGNGADNLNGNAGDDIVFGGAGTDRVNGNLGDDTLTGGAGGDIFVFSQGQDVVTDFDINQSGERIDLRNATTIVDFADLMNGGHLQQSGGSTVINDLNGTTLALQNVDIADLQADDFIF